MDESIKDMNNNNIKHIKLELEKQKEYDFQQNFPTKCPLNLMTD